MAEEAVPLRTQAIQQRVRTRKLERGQIYIDLEHPENGPFVATGEEEVPTGADILSQEDTADDAWEALTSEGWGESEPGAGHRAYDQGAFGQENDPRADVLNAAPPGVGEGLTPHETAEELPRKQGGEKGLKKRRRGS